MEMGSRLRGEREFEVREYVLPKFEAIIQPTTLIAYNQEGDNTIQKIPIGICAK